MIASAETVMPYYTYTQYDENIFIYDNCQMNARTAAMVNLERFFRARHPNNKSTTDILHHLRRTDGVASRDTTI